jgi:cytochrome c556
VDLGLVCRASDRRFATWSVRADCPGPSHPETPFIVRSRTSATIRRYSVFRKKETTIVKNVLLSISLAAIALSFLLPCYGAAPEKIAKVAPIDDLVREADLKVKSLEDALATDKSYLESKGTTIPTEAGVLAVLSQAIVESEEKAAWQPSAKDVRDAAIAVASSKSYDDAKKGLAAIQEAHSGKVGSAKPEHEWNKLCRLASVMKEVNKRNGKLRSATRKKELTDDEAAKAAGDATVMAVLALAAHEDTHEVKKKEEVAEWQKYSKEFQAQMTALSAAARKKDKAAAADAFKKGNTACNDCHGKFRETE